MANKIFPPLTIVDLFCGAGGLSTGFTAAGFRVLKSIDHDEAAAQTYHHNIGDHVVREEITEGVMLPGATVIAGGPPCQGFSSAGTKRSCDHRNTLVSVFAKLVAKHRPLAFIFENVEGFLTSGGGSRVLELLEPLVVAGYRIHLKKLNVANYGVPQHRKRVIVVGGLGWEPTLPPPSHVADCAPGAALVRGDLPKAKTVADALTGLPPVSFREPGVPDGHYVARLDGSHMMRVKNLDPGKTMRDLPTELQHVSYSRRASRRVADGTPSTRRGGAPSGIRRLLADRPSKAITSFAKNEFVHPTEDRFLSLRECARIQGFPDSFKFMGTQARQALLIGNAVPPFFAEQIARHLCSQLNAGVIQDNGAGRLISFTPTLSSGMSPALQEVLATVERRFAISSSLPTQLALCP